MSLKRQMKSIKMLFDLFTPDKQIAPTIQHVPQKKCWEGRTSSCSGEFHFPFSTPEREGIDTHYIREYIRELNIEPTVDIHNIMILRHGNIIWQQSFGGYNADLWHVCYSLSKTVTGLAIGIMWDQDLIDLDESISDIFAHRITSRQYQTHKEVTVRNLLNMTSGVLFNEASALTEDDWVKGFFEAVVINKPGKKFYYNSMNSFMLSAIIKERTGLNMMDYLQSRLWQPLDIQDVYWELSPCGIEKGGWGLYLKLADTAKLGQLIMNDGIWQSDRIISAKWLEMSTSNVRRLPASFGDYNYGYHIWVGKHQPSFLLNGMFGQNMLGIKDTGVLIIANGGNDELFQKGEFFNITHKYFGEKFFPASTGLPVNFNNEISEEISDINTLSREKAARRSFVRLAHKLNGNRYEFKCKNAVAVGLMPLIMQVTQNNFTKGVSAVEFKRGIQLDGRKRIPVINITFTENNKEYIIPVIYGKSGRTQIEFDGEQFEICITGTIRYGHLRIRISYMEMANSRIIELQLKQNATLIELGFSEIPSAEFINRNLEMLLNGKIKSPGAYKVLHKVLARVQTKVTENLAPVLIGTKINDNNK